MIEISRPKWVSVEVWDRAVSVTSELHGKVGIGRNFREDVEMLAIRLVFSAPRMGGIQD